MKLKILIPGDSNFRTQCEGISVGDLEEQIGRLEWDPITFIRLVGGNGDWIECSGAHGHGFSFIYKRGENGYLSKGGADSLCEAMPILKSYLLGGREWENAYDWGDYPLEGYDENEDTVTRIPRSGCMGGVAVLVILLVGICILVPK